jgi:putative ABC transport system ATP-binding protein
MASPSPNCRGLGSRWRAENVGYIFQMHNLVPVLTAYENIELPLLLLPMSARERQQRVGIARAIVAHPTIIVADEPTGDLDAETTLQILDLLQRLNTELGMTLLMVTHDSQAASIAARRLRLEKGVFIEPPASSFVAVAGRN